LPESARDAIADERRPRLSPMSVLELTYMHEIGRARDPAPMMLAALRQSIGLEVADVSFAKLMETAIGLSWTRDPFDRMIAAHAIVADTPLLTADRTILEHLPLASWA
jgi:PIN domain nuclease of toxin-antitoxin system